MVLRALSDMFSNLPGLGKLTLVREAGTLRSDLASQILRHTDGTQW
jgi:hypothetical protein